MSKQTFSRINVDINSLNVSAPGRSGFDLSKSSMQSIPFGKLYPVRCTKLMPNSTVKGSVNPDLQLEKFATPAAGRMRLDTHTFMVAAKRIHNEFRQFMESGQVGRTAKLLPSFRVLYALCNYWNTFFPPLSGFSVSSVTLMDEMNEVLDRHPTILAARCNPSILLYMMFKELIDYFAATFTDPNELSTYNKNVVDYFSVESARLNSIFEALRARADDDFPNLMGSDDSQEQTLYDALNQKQYYVGDFIYDLFGYLFGEGSTLDQLGYPILSYYGSVRTMLNAADAALRKRLITDIDIVSDKWTWDSAALNAYISYWAYAFGQILQISSFDSTADDFVLDNVWDVAVSEMPLRANYAVWFDYFRDWHLDPETSCPNPDDFGSIGYLPQSPTTASGDKVIDLLVFRCRNWSRDGFTMVQPDDVYRHVYAPASTVPGDSDIYNVRNDGFDTLFANVDGGSTGSVSLPFPSSFTNLFGTLSQNVDTYYHDLQTMRRAEMLKRKLTRDYYNPDTYVGQHVARWGVEPADFEIVCSQYLGGNESMINGDQVTSPVETDATTLGQRTLVANASSNDSFVYNMSEWSYLISYVSIVPLVHYDALNPTLMELNVTDQPIPEYANDNQVMIRTCDLVRDYFGTGSTSALGYVARYYGYRMALDDVHGKFLREYRSYAWLRDRKSSGDSMLTKNAINAHVNLSLDCFIGLSVWDTIAFGNVQLPLFVECALPDKLENV